MQIEVEWNGKAEKFELGSPMRPQRRQYLVYLKKLEEVQQSANFQEKWDFLEEFLDWKEKLAISLVTSSSKIVSIEKIDEIPTDVLNKLVETVEGRIMPKKSF